jgi:hypothetical protein
MSSAHNIDIYLCFVSLRDARISICLLPYIRICVYMPVINNARINTGLEYALLEATRVAAAGTAVRDSLPAFLEQGS